MPITPKTLDFLIENRLRDNREWFQEHKKEYKELVLAPMMELVQKMGPAMLEIDSQMVVDPKVDRTISRVYRDTRFSKDKSLYREVMWVVFGKDRKEYPLSPGFVLEFSPDGFRYGCGWYQTAPKLMQALREMILAGDRSFVAAKKAFDSQKVFEIIGDSYKRSRHPDQPEELRSWLDRKSICLMHNSKDFDLLFSDRLGETVMEAFKTIQPVYEFLCMGETRL